MAQNLSGKMKLVKLHLSSHAPTTFAKRKGYSLEHRFGAVPIECCKQAPAGPNHLCNHPIVIDIILVRLRLQTIHCDGNALFVVLPPQRVVVHDVEFLCVPVGSIFQRQGEEDAVVRLRVQDPDRRLRTLEEAPNFDGFKAFEEAQETDLRLLLDPLQGRLICPCRLLGPQSLDSIEDVGSSDASQEQVDGFLCAIVVVPDHLCLLRLVCIKANGFHASGRHCAVEEK
mmetsp:Transcript_41971/g.90657  ORF Transcript_41971/g.90657 Transcript_41971/m.90657 type:complete len:228 (+) Transcript_41971:20-703(+)